MKKGLIIAMVLLCGIARAATNKCLDYRPAVVKLRGMLVRKTFPGPPNYESIRKGDTPENYWLVVLRKPVCVNESKSDPEIDSAKRNIYRIQLVVPTDNFYDKHRKLLGKQVVAVGTLYEAYTGHHKTPVLLWVSTLSKASRALK